MSIINHIIEFLKPGLLDELDNCKSQLLYYRQECKKLPTIKALIGQKETQIKSLEEEIKKCEEKIIKLIASNDSLHLELGKVNNEIEELKGPKLSQIDEFCSKNYKVIKNKVYKQKRKFQDKEIQVFLNQLITPNAFEVLKVKKTLKLNSDRYNNIKEITDKVAKITTWTSDDTLHNMIDFYNYPEETLVIKLADCECISNTITSFLHKEVGTGYGFYNPKGYSEKDKGIGHAFNVFEWHDRLYIAEGTGNKAQLHMYEPSNPKEKYHLLYIITKEYTYKCTDENIEFGYLVNW